jgi:hypothetical protein
VSETTTLHLSDLVDTVAPGALLQNDIGSLPAVFSDWALVDADSFVVKRA